MSRHSSLLHLESTIPFSDSCCRSNPPTDTSCLDTPICTSLTLQQEMGTGWPRAGRCRRKEDA